MRGRTLLPLLLALVALAPAVHAQDRVMMQGFYWDVEPGGVWYDTLTTRAARLAEGERGPGWHEVVLDGRGLTPGVHLVRFHAGSVSQTQKVLLAR